MNEFKPYIDFARSHYCNNDVEIDDNPAISDARDVNGDDGVWVAAWVWVATADIKEIA